MPPVLFMDLTFRWYNVASFSLDRLNDNSSSIRWCRALLEDQFKLTDGIITAVVDVEGIWGTLVHGALVTVWERSNMNTGHQWAVTSAINGL
jgi:hypothetical protein